MERALECRRRSIPAAGNHSKPPSPQFLDPSTHPVKNVSKGLRLLTLGGSTQSSGLVLAASFHSSTLYLTLECQLLAFGFSLLRVAFSWSRTVYFM